MLHGLEPRVVLHDQHVPEEERRHERHQPPGELAPAHDLHPVRELDGDEREGQALDRADDNQRRARLQNDGQRIGVTFGPFARRDHQRPGQPEGAQQRNRGNEHRLPLLLRGQVCRAEDHVGRDEAVHQPRLELDDAGQ